MTKFLLTSVLLVACQAPGSDMLVLVQEDPVGVARPDLTDDQQDRFDAGDARFETLFREPSGLGPAYIRTSCASCHASDLGGPGTVTKMVLSDDSIRANADQSALPYGATQRPYVAGGAAQPLVAPEGLTNLLVTVRHAPAVIGRAWMDAVAEEEILALVDAQAAAGVVSGRANWLDDDRLGRFGVKARVATLLDFSADALLGDMSMTSPMRPDELPNPDGLLDDAKPGVDVDQALVDQITDYLRLLDTPRRLPHAGGEAVFASVGCASCHVPTLHTAADYPVAQLADVEVSPYTDMLLHDMGDASSDGLVEHDATETEFRTAPLVAVRFLRSLLHDGSARTVAEAIAGHGGPGSEANAVVDAVNALSAADRQALIAFVEGL